MPDHIGHNDTPLAPLGITLRFGSMPILEIPTNLIIFAVWTKEEP